MTNFWTISLFWAAFLVFVAVALAFVLPPLLRRNSRPGQVNGKEVNVAIYNDQLAELKSDLDNGELAPSQYEDARRELAKRLSEDVPRESAAETSSRSGRWAAYLLGGTIPVTALALYMVLGSPDALLATRPEAVAPAQGQHDAAPMIAALEAKLKKNPDNAEGWYMLGRSYSSLGRFGEAAQALARVAALTPDDSHVLADYADVLAMTQGKSLQGKPLELINRALKLNENDEKALNLAGAAAYQSGDFARAAGYWRRLLNILPKDSEDYRQIAEAAQDAEKSAGMSGLDNLSKPAKQVRATETPARQPEAAATAASVSGSVTLAKDIAAKVGPTDTVFIFAQLPQGPRMPLASVKISARELPYRFKLDDSMAMTPNDKLSNHPEVVVSARISKTGEAMPHSGDLQGKAGPVRLGQKGVSVVIDTVLP